MEKSIDWYLTTFLALQNLWQRVLNFLPNLIGALLFFVIGWFIALAVGKAVSEILKRVKFDRLFEKEGWKRALERADLKIAPSEFVGAIFKWVLLIVFLQIAVGFLGWTHFTILLDKIIAYLPNVIVAALIFVVVVVVADIVEKIVVAGVERIGFDYARLAGAIIKWTIWVFAILAILQQLKFEGAVWVFDLIKIAFLGIVAMGAIAFGLAGKELAGEVLQDLRKKLKE